MAKPLDLVQSMVNLAGIPYGACQYAGKKNGNYICQRAEAFNESVAGGCNECCTRKDWGECPLNESR